MGGSLLTIVTLLKGGVGGLGGGGGGVKLKSLVPVSRFCPLRNRLSHSTFCNQFIVV